MMLRFVAFKFDFMRNFEGLKKENLQNTLELFNKNIQINKITKIC